MERQCVLSHLNAVAVHGFPLDWNHWTIHEWPAKLNETHDVTKLPVWVSEVGVSSSARKRFGKTPRIHWYSLFDLPRAWPATTRHREAEGSSYYRHFYMGLLWEDGSAKPALRHFREYAPALGMCQWFHFDDPRLDDGVKWLRELGVTRLRAGLSWSDSLRLDADSEGLRPDHTSPPRDVGQFGDSCARMTRRYA